MQESSIIPDPQVGEYKPPMPLMARLMNVFVAPGEVFDDVRQSPPSVANWLAPALIAIVIGWISTTIIFSMDSVKQQLAEISEQAIEKQIEKTKASPEQAEQMRKTIEKFGSVGQKVGGYVGPVVGAFASPFLWGLIVWLVGAKKFHGGFPYMKAVEAVGLSNMIGVLDTILKTLLIVVLGTLWAAPHAGLLVIREFDPQNPVHAILAAVNIMVFWLLAVRAVGLARLSGASFTRSAVWVFLIWFLYTGAFMGFGFLVQRIFAGAGGS